MLAIGFVARILQRHPQQLAKCANSVCVRAYTSTHIRERRGREAREKREEEEERRREGEREGEREREKERVCGERERASSCM